MSEVEKLRALLAEALDAIIGCECDTPNECDEPSHLPLEIKAALAEPVVKGLDVVELEDAALDAEDGRRRAEVSLAEALSSARSWEIHTHAANLRAERAEKERDEARAEVERLRGEAAAWKAHSEAAEKFRQSAVAEAEAEVEQLKVFASRLYAAAIPGVTFATQYEDLMIENVRDGTADRERNAYRRGAEAMREAAAKEVFAFYGWSKDNETTRTDIKNLAELIDDLPVPEDKP